MKYEDEYREVQLDAYPEGCWEQSTSDPLKDLNRHQTHKDPFWELNNIDVEEPLSWELNDVDIESLDIGDVDELYQYGLCNEIRFEED